ncbi:hypothetical protein E2320_004180 [Naja naja]|nr:hypothetical protein E2320_004180 [Naja naja]
MSMVMLFDSIVRVEFFWYWLDENGKWIEYGQQNSKHCAASISSSELEAIFLTDSRRAVFFQAGTQLYTLNFQESLGCRFESSFPFHLFPSTWDQSALPDIGYKLVEVSVSSEEYHEIKMLFEKTMEDCIIHRLQRVQNPSLWQVFQWFVLDFNFPPWGIKIMILLRQKEQMKKLNRGKEIEERLLFHGTSTSHLYDI